MYAVARALCTGQVVGKGLTLEQKIALLEKAAAPRLMQAGVGMHVLPSPLQAVRRIQAKYRTISTAREFSTAGDRLAREQARQQDMHFAAAAAKMQAAQAAAAAAATAARDSQDDGDTDSAPKEAAAVSPREKLRQILGEPFELLSGGALPFLSRTDAWRLCRSMERDREHAWNAPYGYVEQHDAFFHATPPAHPVSPATPRKHIVAHVAVVPRSHRRQAPPPPPTILSTKPWLKAFQPRKDAKPKAPRRAPPAPRRRQPQVVEYRRAPIRIPGFVLQRRLETLQRLTAQPSKVLPYTSLAPSPRAEQTPASTPRPRGAPRSPAIRERQRSPSPAFSEQSIEPASSADEDDTTIPLPAQPSMRHQAARASRSPATVKFS